VWLTRALEPQGLPSIGVVAARLPEHAELAKSLYQLGSSDNLPALVGQTTRAPDPAKNSPKLSCPLHQATAGSARSIVAVAAPVWPRARA
jgi:hypothetical protein